MPRADSRAFGGTAWRSLEYLVLRPPPQPRREAPPKWRRYATDAITSARCSAAFANGEPTAPSEPVPEGFVLATKPEERKA